MCILRSVFTAVVFGAAALAAVLFARPAAAVVILSATGMSGGPSPSWASGSARWATAPTTSAPPALAGYTEANISRDAVFGFGTGPDHVLALPEPPAGLLAASGAAAWVAVRRRRRRAAAAPRPDSGRCTRRPPPSSGPTSAAT